jgi:hypothetical protein
MHEAPPFSIQTGAIWLQTSSHLKEAMIGRGLLISMVRPQKKLRPSDREQRKPPQY